MKSNLATVVLKGQEWVVLDTDETQDKKNAIKELTSAKARASPR